MDNKINTVYTYRLIMDPTVRSITEYVLFYQIMQYTHTDHSEFQ